MAYEGPGTYQHWKGQHYRVLGLALREETKPQGDDLPGGEQVVVYQPMDPGSLLDNREEVFWVRERRNFDAEVEVDGEQVPRFRRVDESLAGRVRRQEDEARGGTSESSEMAE